MGEWRPTVGDPTFLGWFTTFSYFVCTALCAALARHNWPGDRKSFFFWGATALLTLLLGINKQLDLQGLLRELGRQAATAGGWMESRRTVQFWFAVCFGTAVAAGFIGFAFIMGDLFRQFKLTFLGLILLLAFVVIRSAAFHHVDGRIGFGSSGPEISWLLELGGIYLIAIGAFREVRRGGLRNYAAWRRGHRA